MGGTTGAAGAVVGGAVGTNVAVGAGVFVAVGGVNLQVRRGTIHALIGPNGAGKTTVFNVVTGVYAPTAGRVVFEGAPISGLKPSVIARRGITRTFQNIRLFGSRCCRTGRGADF